jgi:hypothetical protein
LTKININSLEINNNYDVSKIDTFEQAKKYGVKTEQL